MNYDEEFLNVFNEYYPFERYIFKTPKSLGLTFDDIFITELFVPYNEIKHVLNENGSIISFTNICKDEIYVKVVGNAGDMRIGYYDFNDHIRENIRYAFISDFGDYEYFDVKTDGGYGFIMNLEKNPENIKSEKLKFGRDLEVIFDRNTVEELINKTIEYHESELEKVKTSLRSL